MVKVGFLRRGLLVCAEVCLTPRPVRSGAPSHSGPRPVRLRCEIARGQDLLDVSRYSRAGWLLASLHGTAFGCWFRPRNSRQYPVIQILSSSTGHLDSSFPANAKVPKPLDSVSASASIDVHRGREYLFLPMSAQRTAPSFFFSPVPGGVLDCQIEVL